MSHLAKLNLKTVHRNVQQDPVVQRREKLCRALEQQLNVLDAALEGKEYTVTGKRWQENEIGERVQIDVQKSVRRWFFEQDNGWYVQCRYGSRVLNVYGKSNAVFVEKLADVRPVLEAFYAAAASGELDKAILLVARAKAG